MSKKRFVATTGAVLAAAYLTISAAHAQVAPGESQTAPDDAAESDDGGSDIIVTARRRDERLQDVPIAVTAIAGDALAARGIQDVQQLNYATPSLQVASSAFGSTVPGYAIRGQRLIESILSVDPSVGVYFADVVQQRPHGTNQVLYDLESVQILKGPQGTLFGRNTTGGAVLITPAKPVLGETTARLSATLGNYDLRGGEAMLNLSDSDKFGIRVASKLRYHDGYGKNLVNGRELNNQNMESFRVGMLWEPAPGISSYTVGSYFNHKDDGFLYSVVELRPSFVPIALRPAAIAAFDRQQARSPFEVEFDGPTYNRTETWSVSNATSVALNDALTLKNIVGYRKVLNDVALDFDALPVLIDDTRNTLSAEQITEELQLLGEAFDNRLNYIVGAYYFRESGLDFQASRFFGGRPSGRAGFAVNKSTSIFAQGDYKFTDQFTLTAGLRQTWDKRSLDNRARTSPPIGDPRPDLSLCRLVDQNGVRLPSDQCSRKTDVSFDKLTYLVSLSYKPTNDALIYLTHNTGYRSGGINLRSVTPAEQRPFNPENVKNYEGGVKLDLLDRRLTINAAAYYTDYKDIQRTIQTNCGNVACVSVENAASANIKGAELEVSARPVAWLTLGGFLGYTKAQYKEFILPTGLDLSNNSFAFVPRTSWGLNGAVTIPVTGDSEISASLNYYNQASMQGADINDTIPIPGYDILNGSISWTKVGGGPIDATFFISNITNNVYAVSSVDLASAFGTNAYAMGDPRTYGFTLTVQFGGGR